MVAPLPLSLFSIGSILTSLCGPPLTLGREPISLEFDTLLLHPRCTHSLILSRLQPGCGLSPLPAYASHLASRG